VFPGYWKRPELNKDTFSEDGYFKTGDVVYVDPRGNFYITDRIKELIKYSMCPHPFLYSLHLHASQRVVLADNKRPEGFQVAPAELEAILLGREDIADACVIGVWDSERSSELPRAYVVPKQGVQPSDEMATSIVQYVEGKVAPPKRLRGGVRFIEEIPKSVSGKILRRVLKEQLKKEEAAIKAKL
jgi:acyl-coenzyme A synthetase/AMP-(fatty) acid ligase